MDHATPALRAALDLLHFPAQVRRIRSAPLPDGMTDLLRIAAGEEEVIKQAIEVSRKSRETVREAASFFAEQILLFPEADSYRVLGANRNASYDELRRHLTLLLRWLHPDRDPRGERSVYTTRVTCAWNDLKTQDARYAYDLSQRKVESRDGKKAVVRARARRQRPRQRRYNGVPYAGFARPYAGNPRVGFFRRILLLLLDRTAH
jgi:hypothetical protein